MKLGAALVASLVLCAGCKLAVKHPAITAGTVAGTLALGSCELASSEHAKCFAISGGGGLAIGLLAAFALWLGTEDEAAPGGDPSRGVDPRNLPPAPVFDPDRSEPGSGSGAGSGSAPSMIAPRAW
jgi:hypothetical protein